MKEKKKHGARKPTEIYSIVLTASPFIWRINEMFHSQWFVYPITDEGVTAELTETLILSWTDYC